MNINDVKIAVKVAYKANRPILMLALPGVGKSSCVYQLAREMEGFEGDRSVIELRTSTADPSEIADLKAIHDGKVINVMQDWVPTAEAVAEGRFPAKGFIFLDEILDGSMMVQSGFQHLVLDRKLGSAKLAPGWMPIAASNRRSDGAAAGRLSTALASRFIVVEVEHDLEATIAYAIAKQWHPMIPAFLRFRPSLLCTFEQAKKAGHVSFACGRTWEILSDVMKTDPPEKIKVAMASGIVGEGVTAEFTAFETIWQELPDLDIIRKNPETAPIPSEPSILYATLGALLSKITKKEFDSIWKFAERLDAEFCTVFVKDCVQKLGSDIVNTKGWAEYVTKYGAYTY